MYWRGKSIPYEFEFVFTLIDKHFSLFVHSHLFSLVGDTFSRSGRCAIGQIAGDIGTRPVLDRKQEGGSRLPAEFAHLPRLKGATCMTLGGTDKKGGSWDRLSWHHADVSVQPPSSSGRPCATTAVPALSGTLLAPPDRPLPYHFRDRPLAALCRRWCPLFPLPFSARALVPWAFFLFATASSVFQSLLSPFLVYYSRDLFYTLDIF